MPALETATQHVLRNRVRALEDGERRILQASITELRAVPAGEVAVRQGQEVTTSTLLVDGWMSRQVDAIDGRRHLVAVHIPGDFVDLHAYALGHLDHNVCALTDTVVALVPHSNLRRIQEDHPHFTRRLWFLTLLDAAMHRQWIFRGSSLSAIERVAHFLCEMQARLLAIDASDGRRFSLPMTQSELGEVCGLTNVHVSRVLRQLREGGYCTVRALQVDIHDLRRLAVLGHFDAAYLYLNKDTEARSNGHLQ